MHTQGDPVFIYSDRPVAMEVIVLTPFLSEKMKVMSAASVEYFVLEYVPNVVSDKSVSIAAVFIDSADLETRPCMISFADDWQAKVLLLDPTADIGMLRALLEEIHTRLSSKSERSECIRQMEDSFSNIIQVSPRRKYRGAYSPTTIEAFARQLWKSPATSRDWCGISA